MTTTKAKSTDEGATIALRQLPAARLVRDVLGHVDIGPYRVRRNPWSGQQKMRFLWEVLGPEQSDSTRETLDEFARYIDACADARDRCRSDLIKPGSGSRK